ncbi:MAG: YkgJ family cysteine cluster protein [Spirochaetes bacterium]|nr:YkgJ family cysteine cluster protein [Spirochaetota bacterium]MBU1081342.1 YkgJ family cysteine cluster protein [Spirochaetota bacterium]
MSRDFWSDGLRFECARCSACCRHEPGFVFLSATDLERLLGHFGLAFRAFFDTLLRTVDVGTGYAISLREKPNNDCILWTEDGCSAYEARPVQCSTYPFWQGVLDAPEDWDREAEDCPGIGRGPIVPRDAIGERLLSRRANPPLIIPYDAALESIDENSLLGRPGIVADPADAG